MARRKTANVPSRSDPANKWLLGSVALLLLAGVALLDYLAGRDFSFTLLYLAPISIAIWFVGALPALVMCFLAAGCSITGELYDNASLSAALWNAGGRLGVYLAFYVILGYLREHKMSGVITPLSRKWIAIGAATPFLVIIAAGIAHHHAPMNGPLLSAAETASSGRLGDHNPLIELSSLVQQSLKLSRPLLLGSRDPNGPSCIQISHTGDVKGVMPENRGDLDGGPGTSLAVLYFYDRQGIKSPLEDFKWHQTRLRTYLENNLTLAASAEELARESAEKASKFLDAANSWSAVPTDVTAIGFTRQDDWPSYCMVAIDKAIDEKDLAATKYWATELAAATFWLDDLMRWRHFLYENLLAALDFQAQCESLFVAAEREGLDYKPESTMSQFPAGVLGLNGKGNFYEVERQAEQLFSMPADRLFAIEQSKQLRPSALWVPPTAREMFLQLRSVLSADSQITWDLAARTPYQHGYLVNLLFRARTAELVDDLATVLKKFDAQILMPA